VRLLIISLTAWTLTSARADGPRRTCCRLRSFHRAERK